MIRWSLFASLLATALCAMLSWGLVVPGHPALWTIDGVLVSVVNAGVVAIVCYHRSGPCGGRLPVWIAAVAWLLLLASSAADYEDFSWGIAISQVVARRALAWVWLVFPFFVADSAVRPRGDRWDFSAWLLLCVGFMAFARTLAWTEMWHGGALIRAWEPVWLIVLIVSPFALTLGLTRHAASGARID